MMQEIMSYKLNRADDGRAEAIVQWFCEKCKCLHQRRESYLAIPANFESVGYYMKDCNQFVDVKMPWFAAPQCVAKEEEAQQQ
jgi:hypothetical protein